MGHHHTFFFLWKRCLFIHYHILWHSKSSHLQLFNPLCLLKSCMNSTYIPIMCNTRLFIFSGDADHFFLSSCTHHVIDVAIPHSYGAIRGSFASCHACSDTAVWVEEGCGSHTGCQRLHSSEFVTGREGIFLNVGIQVLYHGMKVRICIEVVVYCAADWSTAIFMGEQWSECNATATTRFFDACWYGPTRPLCKGRVFIAQWQWWWQLMQGDDVRIFVLNMYPNLTREVLCKVSHSRQKESLQPLKFLTTESQARHLDHSSGYVWITHGWYGDEWWKNGRSECSGEHLETYLDGVIGVTHYPTTDSEHDSYPIVSLL